MAPRDFLAYLEDILDGIEKIEQFTKGVDFESFDSDDKTKGRCGLDMIPYLGRKWRTCATS